MTRVSSWRVAIGSALRYAGAVAAVAAWGALAATGVWLSFQAGVWIAVDDVVGEAFGAPRDALERAGAMRMLRREVTGRAGEMPRPGGERSIGSRLHEASLAAGGGSVSGNTRSAVPAGRNR